MTQGQEQNLIFNLMIKFCTHVYKYYYLSYCEIYGGLDLLLWERRGSRIPWPLEAVRQFNFRAKKVIN